MKKILFLITAFICGAITLKASFAENPGAESFVSESLEIPEGLKIAKQKLYEAKQKVDEINEAKQLGKKNQSQAEIKKLLKELTKIALEFFYESCCESIPFLDQKTRTTQFNALVNVVKDQINDKEYDNAYEYSKKIYYQILKLPDCLNQLKHDGKKTPSKECLTELNYLIFELDKHLYVENSPYSMMSVISPIKREITPDDFELPSADALSNKFECFLIESGLSKEVQSSNNQADLDNVRTNLSELFTIVSSSPVQSEGASVENNRRKKQFNEILSNVIDEEKQLMQNNHKLEEKIVYLEGLFKKVEMQLKISKFEHEKSSQSKDQTIINLQADCENFKAQLKKLKTELKKTDENNSFLLQAIYSIDQQAKSLEADLSKIIQEHFLTIEKQIEVKNTQAAKIDRLFAENEEQAATIAEQKSKIVDKNSTIKEQDSTIKEQDSTIKEQDSTIADQKSTIKKQKAKSKKQKATIKEQDSTIKDKDSIIKDKDSIIKALEFKELWLKRVAGGIAVIAAGWLCIKYVPSSINSFTQGFSSFWRRYATRTRSYVKS